MITQKKQLVDKLLKETEAYRIADAWLFRKEEKSNVADNLTSEGIRNVAIYGTAKFGQHLITELELSNINISYVIDRNPKAQSRGYDLYKPDEQLPMVDAIIITAVGAYDEITKSLQKVIETRIITISELF